MTRRHSLLVGLLLASTTSAFPLPALGDPPASAILPPVVGSPNRAKKALVATDFGRLPLSFERNQGQTDRKVRFLTHSADSTLFLTPSEAVFSMPDPMLAFHTAKTSLQKGRAARRRVVKNTRIALRMQMIGANPRAAALTERPLAGRINYFIGRDPSKWHAGVPTFGRVGFRQVYRGVDLLYYGNQRHLEYDFVVAPHADPNQIKLHFAGAEGVRVNAAGDLLVRMKGRELQWQKPTVYQQDAAGKHAVAARFRLKKMPGGQPGVTFALGRYDTERPLVIDPVLLYSTFLGGSGTDEAYSIAVDNSGNAYVAGAAQSADYPTTAGAFQRVNNAQALGSDNAFITKLNPTGTALLYSTYIGGSGGNSTIYAAHSIVIDSNGSAYVTGYASGNDFPVTPGAFQPGNNAQGASGPNAFVTKLNSTGTALLYSTYLGGTTYDLASCIAVDSGGNAYVTGTAYSTDFPVTAGAFQGVTHAPTTNNGSAFVTKFNSTGTALLYSTYLGGSKTDTAAGIAVDSGGNAYVTGVANSSDFPTTQGAFQRVNNASAANAGNAFVTKLNATGSALFYSTYLGGLGETRGRGDQAYGIAIDSSGNAYITGSASSTDFPTTSGAFQRVKSTANANAFVAKLNSAGAALLYSTYLGGTGSRGDGGYGISTDSSDNAYIAGYTYSSDFPTTPGAFQRAKALTVTNAFVTKLNSTGTALLYSTYLSGSNGVGQGDQARGIAVDSGGNVYVTGSANSSDFPTTQGAFQRVKAANVTNAFVTKLSAVPIFPDFNNDGHTDLLIQNTSTGVIASWFMQGSTWVGGAYFSLTPPIEYALLGAGDFMGAGATALVLQSRNTNQIVFWYTGIGNNNAAITGGDYVNNTPPTGWKVVGVGDFNGDGKSDLVFQNQTTNQLAIWFMNGYLYQGGVLLPFTPPAGWQVAGVGDFNADGFTDLVFQNQSTGQIALWYMNRTTYVGGTVLTTVPASGWKVVGVGDYNGDGSADLLFQNQTSNQAAVWYLRNGAYAGGETLLLAPPPGWKIVGPR